MARSAIVAAMAQRPSHAARRGRVLGPRGGGERGIAAHLVAFALSALSRPSRPSVARSALPVNRRGAQAPPQNGQIDAKVWRNAHRRLAVNVV